MADLISIDAARADEIAAMTIADMTAALAELDLPSRQLVLEAEQGKGDDQRVTAIPVIEASIAELTDPVEEAPAAETAPEVPAVLAEEPVYDGGLVLMHNDDLGGCSWGGTSYEPDDDGAVHVPPAAAEDLMGHGFRFVTAKKA